MFARFDYGTYFDLLAHLCADDRRILRFADTINIPIPPKALILRHDVDLDLESALSLAREEAAREIFSTYFVLLTGPYNALTSQSGEILRQIVALGHEIGLHYDVSALPQSGHPEGVLLDWVDMLGLTTGKSVVSIAMHNPGESGEDPFRGLPWFVNAYAPAFTEEAAYFSDSCGAWRNDTVKRLSSDPLPDRIQLLTHPVLWAETHADRWRRLEALKTRQGEASAAALDAVARMWRTHTGVSEHDRRNEG